LGVLGVLFAGVAFAEGPLPYRIRYETARELDCPDVSTFAAEVEGRTQRVRWARQDEAAIELGVAIASVPGGATGTLTMRAADGTASERRVAAASCAQVVGALALVAALAIDPEASTEPVVRPLPAAPAPDRLSVAPSPPMAPVGWSWQIGISGEALTALAPDLAFWVRPHVELARGDSALRLSVGWARATASQPDGAAALRLLAGRLEACPVRLSVGASLRVVPCAALDAGRLTASGLDVTPSARVHRPWLTGGVSARLAFLALSPMSLELGGELFAPFVRDRFYMGADTTVHRTSAVGGTLSLGVGVRFP
jgi:hypothetical protein